MHRVVGFLTQLELEIKKIGFLLIELVPVCTLIQKELP